MADTYEEALSSTILRERLTAWDIKKNALAALSDKQKDSFMDLSTQSTSRPLPLALPLEEFPMPVNHAAPDHSFEEQFTNIDKIETSQQFMLWYSDLESRLQGADSLGFYEVEGDLRERREACSDVTEEVSRALQQLEDLKVNYVCVANKTNALHDACENLLDEQTKLVNTAENINSRLTYFNELETVSVKLDSPTLSVSSETFLPLFTKLDESLDHITRNSQYREAAVYMAKVRQCISRACAIIKNHVTHILETATAQAQPKQDSTEPPATEDAFTLFYGKFRANSPRVHALMELIEERADRSPEYEQLLADCHTCYFSQRALLLGPSVTGALTSLAGKYARDHCSLMRSCCAFMVHVCEDEHQLFNQFFSRPTPLLDTMLSQLCVRLYDIFRPLIIHINHLETLSELCSILKHEMLEDHVNTSGVALRSFEQAVRQMLEDVQERLVYRTHIYIRAEILGYRPAPGDLAYPDKLVMMQNIAASLQQQSQPSSPAAEVTSRSTDPTTPSVNGQNLPFVSVPLAGDTLPSPGGNMPMSPADLHGMWYPTVRRTLVCLSKLYRCIDRSTFQGLSQESLSLCIQSLIAASQAITKNKGQLDAQLFLIKHLLILREQIAPFQVDFAVKETSLDFSSIKNAAVGLLSARSKVFSIGSNNALLQFLLEGTPHVTETYVDSKKEVDNQLKVTCEEFISFVSEDLVGVLRDFLSKAQTLTEMTTSGSAAPALRAQPFAQPDQLHAVVTETYKRLKQRRPLVLSSMALYLANKDTEHILFKPVKTNVQQSFQELHRLLTDHYTEEDQQIVAAPSLEQINLLLSSTAK